jgi:hypothetical protein
MISRLGLLILSSLVSLNAKAFDKPFPPQFATANGFFRLITSPARLAIKDLADSSDGAESFDDQITYNAFGFNFGLPIYCEVRQYTIAIDQKLVGDVATETVRVMCGQGNDIGTVTLTRKKAGITLTPKSQLAKFEFPEPEGHEDYRLEYDWSRLNFHYTESAKEKMLYATVENSGNKTRFLRYVEYADGEFLYRTYEFDLLYKYTNPKLVIQSQLLDNGTYHNQYTYSSVDNYVDRKTFNTYYNFVILAVRTYMTN